MGLALRSWNDHLAGRFVASTGLWHDHDRSRRILLLAGRISVRLNAAVMVGPGDLRVRRLSGLLTCLGVHTGACVCLFDPVVRAAGLAHVLDSHSGLREVTRPGGYADTAIPGLISRLERIGAEPKRLVAAVVGGSEIRLASEGDDLVLHSDALSAVVELLANRETPIFAREVGGRSERVVTFEVASGRIRVRSNDEERTLCVLGASVSASVAA